MKLTYMGYGDVPPYKYRWTPDGYELEEVVVTAPRGGSDYAFPILGAMGYSGQSGALWHTVFVWERYFESVSDLRSVYGNASPHTSHDAPGPHSLHLDSHIPSGQEDGLKLNSTNTFIYDSRWKVVPLTHRMKAGQHVRIEVKNMNILGVQLDLQDKTFYHYEKTWLGTKKQVYSGDSYTFMLLPYQTKTFDFYRFDYVPMNWTFELGTKISDAVNVQIRFYSDWIPGMPYDPNHPNR